MSTKQTKNRQRSVEPRNGAKDVRLVVRANAIRAYLRESLDFLDGATPEGAAVLARKIVAAAARQRLRVTRWSDTEQTDRDARIGSVVAASLIALDCGMTRAEFAQWLRDGADVCSRETNAPASSGTQR